MMFAGRKSAAVPHRSLLKEIQCIKGENAQKVAVAAAEQC
jgi:hypothetical protein